MSLLPGLCLILTQACPGQDEKKIFIPERYDASRYETTWTRSLFALETAEAVQPEQPFARDLLLTGVSRIRGELAIRVRNRKTRETQRITREVAKGQIRLISVSEGRNPSSVVAEVELGGKRAEIRYDNRSLLAKSKPSDFSEAEAGRPVDPSGVERSSTDSPVTTDSSATSRSSEEGALSGAASAQNDAEASEEVSRSRRKLTIPRPVS